MMDNYAISDLYIMLKLDLFKEGRLENIGYLSSGEFYKDFLPQKLARYKRQTRYIKQLSIGLYLLDSYFFEKNRNNEVTYLLVFCVCNKSINHKEKIYILKLSELSDRIDVLALIDGQSTITKKRKRRSLFRNKGGSSSFDSSPLNAIPRKY